MSCEAKMMGVGVGLYGDNLSGSAIYIIDTKHVNSYINSIAYTTNDFDTLSSSLKCSYKISNYLCDFDNLPYWTMATTSEMVGVSSRYVNFLIEIERDGTDVISPRVYDVSVDFNINTKEYDHRTIYKLKTDIFGFEYGLIKDDLDLDQYNYKFVDGNIVVKTIEGRLIGLDAFIPNSYIKYGYYETDYPNLYNQMLTGIKDFETFYDVLMFITSSYVIFEKGIYDYGQNQYSIDDTSFKIIDLNTLSAVYCDVWFFEKKNEVMVFLMKTTGGACARVPIPMCFKLNVLTGRYEEVEIENTVGLEGLHYLQMTRFEVPVITYDNLKNTFNLGMVFYNSQEEYHILSMNLDYDRSKLYIKSLDVISPVDYTGV